MLANPLRRLWQDPVRILQPHVQAGMTVVEPGPGMGFFTIVLARLVGPSGRVVAVDIQPKMLAVLRRRLAKAGMAERVECRLAAPDTLGLSDLAETADFGLAFAVVHEMPSPAVFFAEMARCLRPHGRLLLVEPSGHVKPTAFAGELRWAASAGFRLTDEPEPAIRGSYAVVLERS